MSKDKYPKQMEANESVNTKYGYFSKNCSKIMPVFFVFCFLVFVILSFPIVFYAWTDNEHTFSNPAQTSNHAEKPSTGTGISFPSITASNHDLREKVKAYIELVIWNMNYSGEKYQDSAFITSRLYDKLFVGHQNQFVKRIKNLNRTKILSIFNNARKMGEMECKTSEEEELYNLFWRMFYISSRIGILRHFYMNSFQFHSRVDLEFLVKEMKWHSFNTNRELVYKLDPESIERLLRFIDEAHLPEFFSKTDYYIMILQEFFAGLSRNWCPLSETEICEIENATFTNSANNKRLDYIYNVEITAAPTNGSKFNITGLKFVFPKNRGISTHEQPLPSLYLWDILSLSNWLKTKNPINTSGKKVPANFYISTQGAREKALGPCYTAFFDAEWADFNKKP